MHLVAWPTVAEVLPYCLLLEHHHCWYGLVPDRHYTGSWVLCLHTDQCEHFRNVMKSLENVSDQYQQFSDKAV